MARPYAGEMERLADTLSWVGSEPLERIRAAVRAAAFSPLRAIGSGGSLTAAAALAALHQRHTGQLAAVATPLEAVDEPVACGVSQWLLSAGGRNVDVLRAATALIGREPRQLAVLCGKPESPLAKLCLEHPFVDLVLAPPPAGKDGFLATNSLLAFVGLLSRAYVTEFGGEDRWREIERAVATLVEGSADTAASWRRDTEPLWSRRTTIVLCSSASRVGAVDLESKFTEAALGNLQFADYRNFAHGRHHWLAKQGHSSGVLAFVTEADRSLAERTLALVPKDIPQARLELPGDEAATNLGSLVAALRITGWAGTARGIDPGQPGVPDFGRKLYNLPLGRTSAPGRTRGLSDRAAAAIGRKAGVSVSALIETGELASWREAFEGFRRRLSDATFGGVVLDYDGTVVETRDRFQPPTQAMSDQLIRLAEEGLHIAIATGRGGSVRRDLARRIPLALQSRFLIGYYNGAEIAGLDDAEAPNNHPEVSVELQALAEALARQPELALAARQENRPFQITLEAARFMPESRLWDLTHQVILMTGANVKVTRSSHSIDIVPTGISKRAVVAAIQRRVGGAPVLAIGDRGRWPGNDYELLSGPYSLGVDEVSIDPAACWNLARPGQRGPMVTLEHLSSLQRHGEGLQFAPDALL